MKQAALSLLVLLALVPRSTVAQDGPRGLRLQAGKPLEQQYRRSYGTEHGLPSGWIYDLVQTRDGYLWVGTDNGLARFDGTRFTVFDMRNTPELPGNNTRALTEARDGTLWIGSTLGLARYRPGRPGVFETIEELRGSSVLSILDSVDGGILVGARDGLWRSHDRTAFHHVPDAPKDLHALAEDADGTLWLGSDGGLFRRDGDRFEKLTEERWYPVQDLHIDRRDVWFSTPYGLRRYADGRLESYQRQEGILRGQVHDLLRARDGTLYAAFGNGLSRTEGEGYATYPCHAPISAMLEDREGGLWVGFRQGAGLHRYQTSWTDARAMGRIVFCALENRHGVWLGTNRGLVRLQGDELTDYGEEHGPPSYIWSLARGKDDSLWIGGVGGLARWVDGAIVPVTESPELIGNNVQAVFEDSTGTLWIGRRSHNTVVVRDGVMQVVTQLVGGPAEWFWEDPAGRIWLGTPKGVYRGSVENLERVTDPELDRIGPNAYDGYATPDGDLWIAMVGGVARYRDGRFDVFTPREGLASEFIERLGADRHGNLWIGGRNGFFYVRLQDFDDVAEGRARQVESRPIADDVGLSTLGGGGFGFPHACLARDGTLYLGSRHGVLTVPPERWPDRSAPSGAIIEAVRVNGRAADSGALLSFPTGPTRLSIAFATPSFSEPEGVRAWYRLDGHDDDWIEAGAERVAHYTDLPAGDYSFRLVSENADGVRSEESLPLDVRVTPRWWQITWVRVALVLGLVSLTGLYYRLRTRSIRRHNAELQREIGERQRAEEESRQHWDQLARVSRAASMGEITTSIAHEVKQPLFAIVSNAQTARRFLDRPVPDHDEIREALADIASDGNRAAQIIDRVRSLVKKEHEPHEELDLNDVARDVIRLVDPEMQRRGLVLETELAEDLPRVKGDPIELQQVLINLVLNGAQAMEEVEETNLTLRTEARNGSVAVTVVDRGVGIDETQSKHLFEPFYTTKPQGTGMGLAMNRAIIARHGGWIRATANMGPGATFEFTLPVSEGRAS